ncbi:DUF3040 domain-containing protein [Curtobacterium sp. MCSS17_015]|uniref:DUF3040 domain-containing protein n=1 Tax=Curtobacterium sp. MCSS17_015 TaxID=2175666 RepID=UPI000DAA73AE|nr:DUF3040 domain-containing protein [Curtobacterium sp. MCSS17_015]WIB27620.1 DUF3040 domain-containing protein [Curtobacterium sp. MCSS17_015]
MPLSEQEQRLLEEMERSLYQNDSDFVARVTRRQGRPTYTAITIGVLIGLVGVGVIVLGLVVKQPLIGVLGFVVMLGGVLFALRPGGRTPTARPTRTASSGPAARGGSRPARGSSGGSFIDRMNERWDKRNQQD